MVVVFTNSITGLHNDNVFSRCTSSLIVVCNKQLADRIYPDSEQNSFAIKIHIEGKQTIFVKNKVVVFIYSCTVDTASWDHFGSEPN
jgi:hypothetical protein